MAPMGDLKTQRQSQGSEYCSFPLDVFIPTGSGVVGLTSAYGAAAAAAAPVTKPVPLLSCRAPPLSHESNYSLGQKEGRNTSHGDLRGCSLVAFISTGGAQGA